MVGKKTLVKPFVMVDERETFRQKVEGVCWQKLLRDRYGTPEDAPEGVEISLKDARVERVGRRVAEQIILKYEWLGTLPTGVSYFYAIKFGEHVGGVVCYGVGGGGANVNAHMEFGLDRYEMAYLVRGANTHWSPPGANSKLIGWSCKLLGKQSTAKMALAYADTDAGEIGTIYQASNWVCIGRGSPTRQWVAPNGRIYDQKYPSNLRARLGGTRAYWRDKLRAEGWFEQQSNPKFRYAFVIDKQDKRLVALIERMRKPYPKRPERVRKPEETNQN